MAREILSGAVLDLHLHDPEATLPGAILDDAAEQHVAAAATLIETGANPKIVLRTLYALAEFEGMTKMARVGS